MTLPDFLDLASRFKQPGVVAIALMGSYARGDAGKFSDIDIVRVYNTDGHPNEAKTYFIDKYFIVVSNVGPLIIESWFSDPDAATKSISGIRKARPLWDPESVFETLQRRALAFAWDREMQVKADIWASSQMVGWIEEVQKGLEGLRTSDEGRMLNARFGLTWGLTNVLRVQRGVLISGDNATYSDVAGDIGQDSNWAALSRQAFGLTDGYSLPDQVKAGLLLYISTFELLADVLNPDDRVLIEEAVTRIKSELAKVSIS